MKEEISRYFGNKKSAVVYMDQVGFVVELSVDGRIMQKTRHNTLTVAEDLAEDFVTDSMSGPTFLSEEN
jgi:hypothetical protein